MPPRTVKKTTAGPGMKRMARLAVEFPTSTGHIAKFYCQSHPLPKPYLNSSNTPQLEKKAGGGRFVDGEGVGKAGGGGGGSREGKGWGRWEEVGGFGNGGGESWEWQGR
ncbi:hypothetical protein Acr_15g0014800 [Actinidia rufa]|uniref:Uncharacterized protein n=1 Tax=Actinidia rufa TaxID=165716 RepID=A0A7J0FW05_9ERIC|nr:hypothetical protein Acr_15g0014800 [Actinidia rufa]